MATLTIRNLDDALASKLRVRAARNNRSLENEPHEILHDGLIGQYQSESAIFVDRMRRRFAGLGDVQLPIEPRQAV